MRKAATGDQRDRLDRFVAQLYRDGLSADPENFRDQGLQRLQELIPFDAAVWGCGNIRDWRFHTVSLLGLPPEYPRVMEETRAQNPLAPVLIKNPDTPVDMESVCPDSKFFKSDFYKQHLRRFGIRRILTTGHADPRTGMLSLLSIYRNDRKRRFTPDEKALQKSAAFHLFEAAAHAYFVHLSRTFRAERTPGGGAAVVDSRGSFHEAQPRFLDLLDEHFPQRERDRLPFPVPGAGRTERHNGLCVKSQPLGDMHSVMAWPAGPLDRLTDRERQIVFAVTRGLSFKQVAQLVKVAPSTVANHLYRVYRKLDVRGRNQLADLVHPSAGPQ